VLHQFTRESDGSTTTTSRSSRQSPLLQASNLLFVPASSLHPRHRKQIHKSTSTSAQVPVVRVKEEEQRSTGPQANKTGHAAAGVRGLSATARPNKSSSSRCKTSRRRDGCTVRSTARHVSRKPRIPFAPAATYCTFVVRPPETDGLRRAQQQRQWQA
jgi:hypothetical protein